METWVSGVNCRFQIKFGYQIRYERASNPREDHRGREHKVSIFKLYFFCGGFDVKYRPRTNPTHTPLPVTQTSHKTSFISPEQPTTSDSRDIILRVL